MISCARLCYLQMDQHHYKFKTQRHGAEETRSDGLGRGEAMRDEVKDREGGLTFVPPESRTWGPRASPCRLSLGMHIPS